MNNTIDSHSQVIEPICPHFGRCGGCTSQDLPYDLELQIKEKNFRQAFTLPEEVFDPTHSGIREGSTYGPYGYRSRMDFLFHDYSLCQRLRGNFRIKVNLTECHLAAPKIDSLLKKINRWFQNKREELPYLTSPDNFNYRTLKYVTIRKPAFTPDASITFVVNRESPSATVWEGYLRQHLPSFVEAISGEAENILIGYVNGNQELSVTPDYRVLSGKDVIKENLGGKEFLFHTQGFFQNNSFMIEKIIEKVSSWLDEFALRKSGNQTDLYDLYGGCGVFGVSLADRFRHVWVVDTEGINIELAAGNFRANGFDNGKVVMQNVKDFLEWEGPEGMDNSVVILDPPRSGLGAKVIRRLLRKAPPVIFYVSCNPKVLAQEIPLFPGYEVRKLAPFDLFPRTPHLEALGLLTRKN